MVNNDQERDDMTKTDGDVNPRLVKLCKKKKTLDLNAVHNTDSEKVTITIDSGGAE